MGDGSSGLSEFGNPAFIVTKLLSKQGCTLDIVDLSSSIGTVIRAAFPIRRQSRKTTRFKYTVEISMGNVTNAILTALNDDATVDASTTLVDESSVDDGLFASNYTVTLKVTDGYNVVANATL